jgi:hypothetical protein
VLLVDGHPVAVLAAVRVVVDTRDLSQRVEGRLWSTEVRAPAGSFGVFARRIFGRGERHGPGVLQLPDRAPLPVHLPELSEEVPTDPARLGYLTCTFVSAEAVRTGEELAGED